MLLVQEHQCFKKELGFPVMRNRQPHRRLLAVRPRLGKQPAASRRLRNRFREARRRWKGRQDLRSDRVRKRRPSEP